MLEFLAAIISFFGLIFGGILALVSPEEMKQGEKWFLILRKAALILLIITFAFFIFPNFIPLVIGGLAGYLIARFLFDKIYFYLGLGLFSAFFTFINDYIVLVSSLIFIFGLPEGTLRLSRTKNWNSLKRLGLNLVFFLIPFLFYFAKDFYILNINWVLAFTAGALTCLIQKKTYSEIFLKT